MAFVGILDLHEVKSKDAPSADYYTDLNLSQIIGTISKGWGENVEKFYKYSPLDEESEAYRRAVYEDIDRTGIFDALCKACNMMNTRNTSLAKKEDVRRELQKQIWHLQEAKLYADALTLLADAMEGCDFTSEGMREFRDALSSYLASEEFREVQRISAEVTDGLASSRITMVYENGRLTLSEVLVPASGDTSEGSETPADTGHTKEDAEAVIRRLYPDNPETMESPFSYTPDLDGLEQEILRLYTGKNPRLFDMAEMFYKKHANYAQEWILTFFDEISFYLSFMRFERHMREHGFSFACPSVDKDRDISADGLYDLALAISNLQRGLPVVDNDFFFGDAERFFVLTGPNQGGKTTFARSLGQLVFFTKMGLRVPAKRANLHYFSIIMTHFSVEESVETGRGKLMEELVRLAPMMQGAHQNAFVILNELFTTAANYDSCIMGKKVLDFFIGAECHGIYVTHLSELLNSQPRAVGLCAQFGADGRQTFKILREIMDYDHCAAVQVDKYGLTYEQLKERLS